MLITKDKKRTLQNLKKIDSSFMSMKQNSRIGNFDQKF